MAGEDSLKIKLASSLNNFTGLLDTYILEKEKEIGSLKKEVDRLHKDIKLKEESYNDLSKKYVDYRSKNEELLLDLREENEKLYARLENIDEKLLKSKNIFTEEIDMKYLTDIDWEKTSIEEAEVIFSILSEERKLEEIDYMLINLVFYKADNINNIELKTLIEFFIVYIELWLEDGGDYPASLTEFLDIIIGHKIYNDEYFNDFMDQSHDKIYSILKNNCKYEEYMDLMLNFLDIIILRGDYKKSGAFDGLKELLKEIDYKTMDLQDLELLRFLFIAIYFDFDKDVFNYITLFDSIYDLEEIGYYKKYKRMTILKDQIEDKDIKELDNLVKSEKLNISHNVVNRMKKDILETKYKNLVDGFYMTRNRDRCIKDNEKFTIKKVETIYSKNREAQGVVEIEALHCSVCNKYYLDDSLKRNALAKLNKLGVDLKISIDANLFNRKKHPKGYMEIPEYNEDDLE